MCTEGVLVRFLSTSKVFRSFHDVIFLNQSYSSPYELV